MPSNDRRSGSSSQRGGTGDDDLREPETPSDHRPLFIFGSPMGASGFEQPGSHFGDRTVITHDPRGMERRAGARQRAHR